MHMSEIVGKDKLLTKLVALRVDESTYLRVETLKSTTSINVNETLRLWLDEKVSELERVAAEYPKEKSA